MKMRLGFAVNVNTDPEILVVDEALSVGDANFKKKCKRAIADIIKKGTTVLYVSHSPEGVKEICHRAIYLIKGKVVFDGPVEDALAIYAENNSKKAPPKKK